MTFTTIAARCAAQKQAGMFEDDAAPLGLTEYPDDAARQAQERRDSIKRLDREVLAAIDRRDFTTADKLDRQRTKLERQA